MEEPSVEEDKMKHQFLLNDEECFYQSAATVLTERSTALNGSSTLFSRMLPSRSLPASDPTKTNHHHRRQAGYDAGRRETN